MPISIKRCLLATGLLALPGAWLILNGTSSYPSQVFFGGLVTGGALLLGRRDVVSQVVGRGAAWALFAPCALAMAIQLVMDRSLPDVHSVAMGATAGAALALTRPILETNEARAAFAPLAFRRCLLLASSAAVAYAMWMSTLAFELTFGLGLEWVILVLGVPLLAVFLLASAVGVARMRAWGILLGGLSSVLALILGATASFNMLGMLGGAVIASATLPGAMMVGAIAIARQRASHVLPHASTSAIASEPEPVIRPAVLRIATPDEVPRETLDAPYASTVMRA
jgi:hypothetical protein